MSMREGHLLKIVWQQIILHHQWVSLLCLILIFFLPQFKVSSRSVYAVVLTQLTDSVSLAIMVIGIERNVPTRPNVSKIASNLVITLPFAIVAAVLVYIFTCELSVILIVPTLILLSATKIREIGKTGKVWNGNPSRNRENLYSAIASFISSATAFNQLVLVTFPKYAYPEGQQFYAFLSLFILTLVSGISNLLFTLMRFGYSFPYVPLIFAVSGSLVGRLVARVAPLKVSPDIFEKIYYIGQFCSF
jgi:hypothetical protein